jgi:predicted transcriptional regulator
MSYPESVEKEVERMMKNLDEALAESEDVEANELRISFSKRIFQKFLDGEELELGKTEIEDSIDEASINTTYNSLVEKGILNFYQAEDGEKHYFLTEEGKKLGKELAKRQQK